MPSPAAQYFNTVQSIFLAYYQRPADAGGLLYWSNRLLVANGDVNTIINEFATSPESVALYGPINNSTIGNVVDAMYLAMFNHLPDAAGKAFYVAGFVAGTFTAGTIALNILNGAQGNDAVSVLNKVTASNNFTQIQDGRTYDNPLFGQGTVFNATYAGNADAIAARAWLAPVGFNSATIPSLLQTENFIKASIANAGDPILQPDFVTTADMPSVVEGGVVTFTVTAKNPFVQAGLTYDYNLTGPGLTPGDIVGGLTGTITFDVTGKALIAVTTVNDFVMETGESISVFLVGVPAANQTSVAVTIVDSTAGSTFIFTPGLDVPPATNGTAFDDNWFANGATLNPGDIANDPSTTDNDTFTYASGTPGFPVMQSGFVLGNIENMYLTADENTTFDMSGVTGTKVVRDTNSRNDLTLNNGPQIVDLEMINTTVAHNFIVNYQGATVAGGGHSQNLLLNGVLAGSMVQVNGIETMNVTTAGTSSSLTTIASNALSTFNLDGSTSLTLDWLTSPGGLAVNTSNGGSFTVGNLTAGGALNVNADNAGNLTLNSVTVGSGNSTIDASGIGGQMYVLLANAASAGNNVAVIGSNNTDQLDVQAGFNAGDSFDGGGSYDYLYANAAISVNTNAITNTEEVDVLSGVLGTLDLDMFDTALSYLYIGTGTLPAVTISNIENDGSEQIVINDAAAALNGKQLDLLPVSFGGTVNLDIVGISGSNTLNLGDGVGTNNLTTLNLGLFTNGGPGGYTINLDPTSSLATLGLEGNADITIDSTPDGSAPISLVNGQTTTGNVTILPFVLSNSGSTVFLGSGYDTVYGGNGPDIIDIGTGGGYVEGGMGNDEIYGSGSGGVTFFGDDGDDLLSGGDSSDNLYGGNGADTLLGYAGYDYLQGDGGSDTLDGGVDDDKLFGGVGADTLTGGGGIDTFYYDNINQSQGAAFSDIITDFVSGSGDLIDLLQALIPANPSVTTMDDVVFAGNAPGFAAAQSALSGTGGVEIVYDTIAEQVYVDVDGNGLIDGVNDMIIRFASPATMQASDFGITPGNTFTANTAGFDTLDAADSFENTTTQQFQNNIVNALGNQLLGSKIYGGNGFDVLNVKTAITAPFNFNTDGFGGGPVFQDDYEKLNLAGGTTALVIGPDTVFGQKIYIGNGGSIFTTGNVVFTFLGFGNDVSSGTGVDIITLTNDTDNAATHAGDDKVTSASGNFVGTIDLGTGADTLETSGNFAGSTLIGGGDIQDIIQAHDGTDLSGATISGFDRVVMDPFTAGFLTIDLDDYNALPGLGSPFGRIVAAGYNDTVTLIGAGSADLDANIKTWNGDNNAQTFVLTTQSPGAPLFPFPPGNSQVVNMLGDDDTLISNSSSLHGAYDGGTGTDTFVQNGDSDWTTFTAASFTSFATLELNNTNFLGFGNQVVTMLNSQHNSFASIVGNDGGFPGFGGNTINIIDAFSGRTQNTIEIYNLANPGFAENYEVGGSNQTVNDPNTGISHIDVNAGVSNTIINQTGNNNNIYHFFGGGFGVATKVTINSGSGNDTFANTFGISAASVTLNMDGGDDNVTLQDGTGFNTVDMGIGIDTANITDVTGLNLSFQAELIGDFVNLAGTVSGNITEFGNTALAYTIANGSDLSGLITNFSSAFGDNVTFATNGTFTLNDQTYDQFATAPILVTATGTETINISNTASITALTLATALAVGSEVENYKFLGLGTNDTFEFKITAGETQQFTLDITTGGSDKVIFDNVLPTALQTTRLTVTGFSVADDVMSLRELGVASGAFQEITVANTALAVPVLGVIELNNVLATLIVPTDVSTFGAVASLIAAAVGTVASTGDYFAVAYATDGNAYVYEFGAVAVADLVAPINIQLVGQLNNITANSLGFVNFVP